MPAAAVIPAPIAYIKVVAVKKLVVGPLLKGTGLRLAKVSGTILASSQLLGARLTACSGFCDFHFEENRVFVAGSRFV